jgi:hypothetical protein
MGENIKNSFSFGIKKNNLGFFALLFTQKNKLN